MTALGIARSVVSILQTLQGDYSSGQLLVRSTGATGTLPAYSHAIPVVDGALAEDSIVRVEKNTATSDGSWPVVDSGTLVSVTSLQGGSHVNLAAGVECRWDPEISGIEEASEVAPGGLAGGTRLASVGALRQVRVYFELTQEVARDLFRAEVGEFPAAVLAWDSETPAEGSVSAVFGSSPGRQGRNKRAFKAQWNLFLISSRLDQASQRKREGWTLRDDVLELLTDRTAWRGCTVSLPQGIEIIEARVFHVSPTSYVDVVRFTTSYTLKTRDERTWNDWLRTRLVQRFDEPDPGAGDIDVPDILVDMT